LWVGRADLRVRLAEIRGEARPAAYTYGSRLRRVGTALPISYSAFSMAQGCGAPAYRGPPLRGGRSRQRSVLAVRSDPQVSSIAARSSITSMSHGTAPSQQLAIRLPSHVGQAGASPHHRRPPRTRDDPRLASRADHGCLCRLRVRELYHTPLAHLAVCAGPTVFSV
jgi:hypothetical protein